MPAPECGPPVNDDKLNDISVAGCSMSNNMFELCTRKLFDVFSKNELKMVKSVFCVCFFDIDIGLFKSMVICVSVLYLRIVH